MFQMEFPEMKFPKSIVLPILFPLVGTPERIVDELLRIAAEGYEGAALSFVNYSYELPHFCDRVLPLLRQAGLRVEATA